MAHTLRTTEHSQPRARDLFKADHPREIDRLIEFFGDHETSTRDMCGEALLDALTKESRETDEVSSCA